MATATKIVWVETVGSYVEMPVRYDAARVSSDDVAHDSALRLVDAPAYYAVCDASGPISVRLDGDSEESARVAFEALDGRAAIDAARTDAEDDLDIINADQMTEGDFHSALRDAGAVMVADLEPIANANAGTVAHLAGGWTLWMVRR